MRKHLNTLYVTLDGAYIHKSGKAVEIRIKDETRLRVPLHNLESIVAFGWDITASAALMHGCAEAGVGLSFLSPTGKFLASSYGGVSGNILLRKDQYHTSESSEGTLLISKQIVIAKIANSRSTLMRTVRDHCLEDSEKSDALVRAADSLKHRMRMAEQTSDLDVLRGIEGEAAQIYFSVFNHMITDDSGTLVFNGRNRNPPTDPANALLSFLYVILMHDCKSACEAVGLDPQCGFLHRDRPGRFSLALDLAEEFRSYLADRLVLSLINRKQITAKDFDFLENGAVLLKEDSRKIVLAAWQERKQEEILHPVLKEKITIGLLPHIQARLLTRHLRGDIDHYPAFWVK